MEAAFDANQSEMTTQPSDYGDMDFPMSTRGVTEAMDHYVLPVIFSLTFVFGVAGNCLVLFVIFYMRKGALRRVTNLYLVNLAIADLLVLLLCVPFTGLIYTLDNWPFGGIICKVSNYLMMVSMANSILTMTAMSIDRYCAVVGSIGNKAHCNSTLHSTLAVLAGIWGLNLILTSPTLFMTDVLSFNDLRSSFSTCAEVYLSQDLSRAYTLSLFTFYYAIPLAVIAISYIMMAGKLWGSIRPSSLPPSSTMRAIRRHRHVCLTVMVMVGCFAICWLPIHVVHMYTDFTVSPKPTVALYVLKVIAHTLSYVNSALNPAIYSLMSHVFRQCCRSTLQALCPSSNEATHQANRSANTGAPTANRVLGRQRSVKMTNREPLRGALQDHMPMRITVDSSDPNNGDTVLRHTSSI